jgi:hydrogenase expression/formation protein HypC
MCLAVPGQLLEIKETEDPLARTGRASFGGVIKEISLAYLPEARVGDYVTVHVGFALSVVSEEDARLVFDFLQQRDEADAEAA